MKLLVFCEQKCQKYTTWQIIFSRWWQTHNEIFWSIHQEDTTKIICCVPSCYLECLGQGLLLLYNKSSVLWNTKIGTDMSWTALKVLYRVIFYKYLQFLNKSHMYYYFQLCHQYFHYCRLSSMLHSQAIIITPQTPDKRFEANPSSRLCQIWVILLFPHFSFSFMRDT